MIGVLSDAHGNRRAFDLSIKILKRYGATAFIYLGDAIGYIPKPGVVTAIQELGDAIRCVRGNHEDMILSAKFDPLREPSYQHEATKQKMNAEEFNFISSWPRQLTLDFACGKALFIHGSPLDPTYGYVYPDTDLDPFQVEERFVFMAHSHRPFIRGHKGKTFINVGSCGLPRDNGMLGCVALFNDRTGRVRLLRFDIRRESNAALRTSDHVDKSVTDLFNRRTEDFAGEIVDN